MLLTMIKKSSLAVVRMLFRIFCLLLELRIHSVFVDKITEVYLSPLLKGKVDVNMEFSLHL